MKKFLGVAALAATVGLMAASNAHAVPQACSDDTAGKVIANVGCQFDPALSNDEASDVNGVPFFGVTNWSFIDKNELIDNTGGLVTTGTDLAGGWSINGFQTDLFYLMTFKAGNVASGVRPAEVVAYLINTASGTWMSPFLNAQNDNAKEVSHISLFSTPDNPDGFDPKVPVPAALPLMLTAIGVAGFMARRRRDRV